MKNTSSDQWREFLPEILKIAHIGIWEMYFSPAGVTIAFSEELRLLFGYEIGDIAGSWETFLGTACHPDYQNELRSLIAATAVTPGGSLHYEFPAWNKHYGEWRWVYIFGAARKGDAPGTVSILGGVQDIHQRRDTQKQLERQQQEALQTIALQKAVLEQQIQEQTDLLRDVQSRVDSILGSTSPLAAGTGPAPAGTDVYDEVDLLFAEGLHKAFDIITDKMAWYKAVIDSIPFPISVTGLDGRWMYLNRPGLATEGVTLLEDIFDRPARTWSSQGARMESGAGADMFTLRDEETRRMFQGQASSLYDNSGKIIGHIETMQDVTEVHEADLRTRLMLDAMPLACSFWDDSFRVIDCNQAAVSLFKMRDKQDYIDNFHAISPERQPCGGLSADLAMQRVKATARGEPQHFEWMHKDSRGELIPASVTMERLAWRGGFVVVGYAMDLRELKAAQQERDKERLLFKEILDSCPLCMMILTHGKVRFATPFAAEFLGIREGDTLSAMHISPAEARGLNKELRRNRTLNWRPVELQSPAGPKHMLANAFFTDLYGEEAMVFWLVDVTAMRKKERQILIARDAAEESTRAKSEFLANMSHEIRTPLNAVLGMTHLILRTEMTDKQRDYLEKIDYSGKSLLRIINDILDFSKIEAGKLEMEKVPFSIETVMRDVAAVTSASAREKGLEIFIAIPPGLPQKVEGDPLRLHQVLLNLTSNAVKFTSAGSIRMAVTNYAAGENTVRVEFNVTDTGIGLDASVAAKLFSPFTQADTSTTRQYGGTGLGLAICKRLVEMMDGAIWCDSAPGKGATFRFTARFGAVDDAPAQNPARVPRCNALLLGDNAPSLASMQSMLESMGFAATTAPDLDRGAALLGHPAGFDVLIMDWLSPAENVKNALEFLRRKFGRDLPPTLLALPAPLRPEDAEPEIMAKAVTGITAILPKPATPSDLFNALNGILGGPDSVRVERAPHRDREQDDACAALAALGGVRVLLVEDNLINQMVARELLEIAGLNVDIANNGREAADMLTPGTYALILMDIQMPVMDGIAATKIIRADKRFDDVPIIAMTALAMRRDRERSLEAGMNDHVTKPIDAAELYTTLAKWLVK